MLTTLFCGGRLEVELVSASDGPARTEDGAMALNLTPGRLWWDVEEISEVVAEATAVAWYGASPDGDDVEP